MKKMLLKILLLMVIFLVNPYYVLAHPGRLDGHNCHTCRTNCAKWGLSQNEYHCHGGNSNQSNTEVSNKSNNSVSNSNETVYKKSSNANLDYVKIDDEKITAKEIMSFKTSNDKISIVGVAEHIKAKVDVKQSDKLVHGLNQIMIKVTAENGTSKTYILNVQLLSNDATLKSLKVSDFDLKINDKMEYVTTNNKINLEFKAHDNKAKVICDNEYKLNVGDNEIKVKVIAEDQKTVKEYILNVKREEKLSDNVGVKVFINGKEVIFNNYISETISISSDQEEIELKYKLEDRKAKIDLDYDKKINVGDRTIKFKVIAQNGKEQLYTLKLYKHNRGEEIISTIIAFSFLGGVGFGIYILAKKLKSRG